MGTVMGSKIVSKISIPRTIAKVVLVADRNPNVRITARRSFRGAGFYHGRKSNPDIAQTLTSLPVGPVWTHFEWPRKRWENGKHVFVEKPFTLQRGSGEELVELAARKNLKIMAGPHLPVHGRRAKKSKRWSTKKNLGISNTTMPCGLWKYRIIP